MVFCRHHVKRKYLWYMVCWIRSCTEIGSYWTGKSCRFDDWYRSCNWWVVFTKSNLIVVIKWVNWKYDNHILHDLAFGMLKWTYQVGISGYNIWIRTNVLHRQYAWEPRIMYFLRQLLSWISHYLLNQVIFLPVKV